ncbi:HNH endonuclease [Fodinibius sp. SL11]|uniref:HNH endonuclease n=1 Tax=Fodinibius sp. SL11 TaxID=3425690 RepID=UPI003F8807FA
MVENQKTIDPYLFNKVFKAFSNFVKSKSKIDDLSFVSNPYLEDQEFYKYEVYNKGRKNLTFNSWEKSDIGTGRIGRAIISAIEFESNNLFNWHPRYGEPNLAHYDLKKAVEKSEALPKYESVFYELYLTGNTERSFEKLIELFGKRYPFLAYLLFLKDRSRFMPIAPSYFDEGFEMLGVNFKTSHQCSWENYQIYNSLLDQLKVLLEQKIESDVSLLDAHSFMWIAAKKINTEIDSTEHDEYLELDKKEREAITKARIGQGRFRSLLIKYWEKCAVTGCHNNSLLTASHIKPWSECKVDEAIDKFNGILLSPSMDSAFDSGLISFKNDGSIMISNALSDSDAQSVGINSDLELRRIEDSHKEYLAYHRKHIFRQES